MDFWQPIFHSHLDAGYPIIDDQVGDSGDDTDDNVSEEDNVLASDDDDLINYSDAGGEFSDD